MGEDGFVVKQIPLRIKAHHLAARAESGVDAHHSLLSQRCGEQQLPQVLHENADGLFISLLFAHRGKLILYGRFQQTLVSVFHCFGNQCLAFARTVYIAAF